MNIYITLDYELFLNDQTGDVDHCLILPTHELLHVLDKHQVKVTFFIDAAYLLRLNELKETYPALNDDFEKVATQIRMIVLRGHKIALHLHPQWFYSDYDGTHWHMDFDHYKMADLPQEEADRYFVESLNLLKSLSGKDIDAFRAGGYSIQGYASFPEILVRNGINKDSSALFGMKNLSHLHYYDYTSLPVPEIYKFDRDILCCAPDGVITEYPIATARMSFLRYCYYKIKNRRIIDNSNWGNGGDIPSNRKKGFMINLKKKFGRPIYAPATIDYQSFTFTDYVLKQVQKKSSNMVVIGHPKNFSPATLAYLESLLNNKNFLFKTI